MKRSTKKKAISIDIGSARREWPPRPRGRFDLPLAHGGPIAILMAADLGNPDDVAALQRTHNLRSPEPEAAYASTGHLRLAQEIGNALNEAMFGGEDLYLWKLIADAHAAIFTQSDRRCAAIHAIEDAHSTVQRSQEAARAGRRMASRIAELADQRTAIVLRTLGEYDERFKQISLERFRAVLGEKRLRPLGIATKLSVECGAFDDTRRQHETEAMAQKRVKRNYEKALEHARKAQVPS